jgi:hypothetical protein
VGSKVKYTNMLEKLSQLDWGYVYYGKGGALEFVTQDSGHHIYVTVRTRNGNYSKTFPGLNLVEAGTADASRAMCFGASVNNVSNDPASQLAVQAQ